MVDIPLPKVLYHYTTQDGLLGILNQHALWTTKIHYLNDSSELLAPLKDAQNILLKLSEDESSKEHDIIVKMYGKTISWEDVNLCVCSFCEEGDRLSQWRAYGVPGSAYSIGFDPQRLKDKASEYKFKLFKCNYLKPAQRPKQISRFITDAITQEISTGEAQGFIGEFFKWAATIKDEAFIEEHEWRLVSNEPVSYTDERFSFRPGKSMIIPYYSLPIDLSCITEIIIGPSPHPELVKEAILGLAHKYDLKILDSRKVKLSSIPYRNW